MIGDLKPYPSMRESGVPWLGKVPDHWAVLPNRALFAEVKDRNHPEEEMLSVTITQGVVKQKELLADSSKKDTSNLDRSAYKLVQPRDIAYNKMRAWQGAIGASGYRGIISPAYVVMRLRGDANPRYFHHLYRTPQFAKEAERWSYGITSDMWSLRPEHFRLIYSLLPPREEQDAIVRLVELVDRQVRIYVLAKQRLIKLLDEQKRAVIHRFVTRGLEWNVPLKPSGVDWLKDVPVRWGVKPVGSFCRYISYGFTNPMPTADIGPLMLTANDIGDGNILYETARHTSQMAYDSLLTSKSRPQKDDVLVTKDGSLGRVAISDGRPVCINQSVALLRVDQKQIRPEYLTTALRSPIYLERMVLDAGGTTIKHIYITRLAKMRMAIPPLPEQDDILREIQKQVKDVDLALRCAQREIKLFREYRTRLIMNVVTGKLDVREASRALPEEIQGVVPVTESDDLTDVEATDANSEETAEEAEA